MTRSFRIAEFNQGVTLVVVENRPCLVVEFDTGHACKLGQHLRWAIGRNGGAARIVGEDLGRRISTRERDFFDEGSQRTLFLL